MNRFLSCAAAFGLVLASASLTIADTIELRSGETLIGTIVDRTDEVVVFDHEVLGRITIAHADIVTLPEEAAVEAIELEKAPQWESQFDLGLSGSQGNTDTIDFRLAFLTTHETDIARWRIDASYYYGETDGEKNKSQATAGVLRDWLMPDSPWIYFAQGRYDFDEFRDWTHRASGHGGVGYEFINDETFQLIGRLGAGAAKEWKESESLRPEGLIGGEFRWNISDRQRFTAHTTLYPDLSDFFEFRVVSGAQWTMKLDNARGLTLSAGIDNEYESQTDDGVKNNDLKFYAGITLMF